MTETLTLTDFLLARIAEVQQVTYDPARVLAECEAKRRIVQEYGWAYRQTSGEGLWIALRLLALPYADHPDHREEWKP